MMSPDTPPTRAEIKQQMRKMLSSPRFRNAPNPSAFLALAVHRHLAGKTTTGNDVAEALFNEKFIKGETPDVRVTASNLRKTLAKYYKAEGHDDAIIISFMQYEDKTITLREGAAYTPHFSYNEDYWLMVGIKIGYACLERWTYSNHLRAFEVFCSMLEEAPKHLAPCLGLVETFCRFDYRGWELPLPMDWKAYSTALLDELEITAPSYWRLWAVRGCLYLVVEGDTEKARLAFARAHALNKDKTESYRPYVEFLLKDGEVDEAVTLANNFLAVNLNDGYEHAYFGMYLVWLSRMEPALMHLRLALDFDPGNVAAHEVLAVVQLLERKPLDALEHMQVLKLLCDPVTYTQAVTDIARLEARIGPDRTVAEALGRGATSPLLLTEKC